MSKTGRRATQDMTEMQEEIFTFFAQNHKALQAAKNASEAEVSARDGAVAVEALRKAEQPLGGALDKVVDQLQNQIADDFTFIDPYGRVVNKAAYVQRLRTGIGIFDNFKRSLYNIRVHGDRAVITCLLSVKGEIGGQDIGGKYYETHTLCKQNTGWQLVASQMTLNQPMGKLFKKKVESDASA